MSALMLLPANLAAAHDATALQVPVSVTDGLQWRGIGPFRGGRALAVAGVPGAPNTFYFCAAAGVVWRTTDAGGRWSPILDDAGTGSIGVIAVKASNPNFIYAGTGEGTLRGDITYGGHVEIGRRHG